MGQKDNLTKKYMSDKERFADAFNFFLYEGKQVNQMSYNIRPKSSFLYGMLTEDKILSTIITKDKN